MQPPRAGKHFPLGNPAMRTLVGVATTAVVAMVLSPALVIGFALLAKALSLSTWLVGLAIPLGLYGGYALARAARLPDIWVGESGLTVRRGHRDRFIPFSEVVGIEAEGEKIALHRSSGACERFTTRTAQGGDGGDPAQAREVVAAVREAMGRCVERSPRVAPFVAKHFVLGRPEARRAASFGIGALAFVPTFSVLTSLLALVVVAPGLLPAWALWAGAIPAAWFARWCVRRFALAELQIGADGVAIQRGGHEEYLPYEQIDVEARAESIVIRREGGATDTLTTRTAQGGDSGDPDQVLEVVAAIIAAKAARGLPRSPRPHALVERRARTIDAWRSALVGLVERGGDYREASLTPEDLASVLEDPAAPAEQRIGAALGLTSLRGSDGAEAALERIRIAAAATANSRVRIALSKAADDELDEAAVDEACMEEATKSESGVSA